MTAHRYWRASGITSYGDALALSAFWLLAGVDRVDATATLTASQPPDGGALAALQGDAPGPATLVRWRDCASLVLTWAFDAPCEVSDIRLAAGGQVAEFAARVCLDCSDDGMTWSLYAELTSIAWPGAWQVSGSSASNQPVSLVYAPDWSAASASAPTDLTLFANPSGASALAQDGALTVTAVGDGGFARTRLDACPPLADFEASLTVSGVRPALVFHQTYWGNVASSLAWHIYAYYGQVYVNRGTNSADAGSMVQTAVANYSGSALCVRVMERKLTVYGGSTATGAPLITQTLDAYTGAGQFALGAVGGAATFRDLRIRRLGTFINRAPGGALARALPRPASAAGAAAPRPHAAALPAVARARGNYALNTNVSNQTGRVRGTVLHQDLPANTPVHRRVRLYRSRDGLLVGQQWSEAATGAYDFPWVEIDQTYTVIADDYAGNWRAVVADGITPEAMQP